MRISKFIKIVLLFLFVQISFAQNIVFKELSGKVTEGTTPVENVNIINNNTQAATVTDSDGNFSIPVREGDVLVFSAVNLEPVKLRITTEQLSLKELIVRMTAKEVQLKEVVVNENAGITAENLGIVPRGQKKYTPAERKVYTATSTSIDKLLNKISGRTAMLKKEVDVEKKEMLFRKMEYLFDENYYTERLKIPVNDVKGFQLFCIDDAEFAVSLNSKNKTMSMFLITDLARKYLTILGNEK
ncbi:carboxypeptidase-like regulatory domain-containing protein [Flavobacterium procerum]|uniref:Carboxypeptidase-like regulatory domain-containing protein n=1 Tax=Flavobacterium procerum TaxID=1455569 RepID=A0ABV6BU13_9FLAO